MNYKNQVFYSVRLRSSTFESELGFQSSFFEMLIDVVSAYDRLSMIKAALAGAMRSRCRVCGRVLCPLAVETVIC